MSERTLAAPGTDTRPRRVRALAPAKLNLQLRVLGRRSDGYHELDTLLLAVDWCDELLVEERALDGVQLSVSGPAAAEIPLGQANLAWRAAERALACARALGKQARGLALALDKHLPSQAGLGGASSDAAAAFLAGMWVFGLEPDDPATRALAQAELAALGSDCAFFAQARSTGLARCTGRGEVVQPLEKVQAPRWLALLVPEAPASTAAVYAQLASCLSGVRALPTVTPGLLELELTRARAALANDLEPAALEAVPQLRRWRALLDGAGASHWCLSGSGSSFFGLYGEPERARAELEHLAHHARAQDLGLRAARVLRPAGGTLSLLPA
jgi:4-diphosphocytidyl-2-C-methyl-D-erythritol kinase